MSKRNVSIGATRGSRCRDVSDQAEREAIRDYFLKEWNTMAEKTRSSIVLTLTSVCDPFLRGTLRDLFSKEMTLTPDEALDGRVIVIDLPVKEFNELGRYAGTLWKFLFQRAAERRVGPKFPAFLFVDEMQFFVTSTDAEFQSTARSAGIASVYATQNRATLFAKARRESVDSLLGNLQTKIFHQNTDTETNRWASETIQKLLVERSSSSYNVSQDAKPGFDKY